MGEAVWALSQGFDKVLCEVDPSIEGRGLISIAAVCSRGYQAGHEEAQGMRGRMVELWHETCISRLSDKMIGRLV